MQISPIGVIKTPFNDLKGMPIQPTGARDIEGTLVINPEYEPGLADIQGFSHIILLYHFHKSSGYDLLVTPFLDTQKRGLFSTRAPRRPNPIGLSIVELTGRDKNLIFVRGIDVLNNTPLIDIKPYVPKFDIKEVTATGWLEKTQKKAATMKSDDRFMEK
ncbi:MAG: tRNA (N6-threonylcarbamoyladenosine(37)-N6)-methyltransferase TrmO [Proteobacteria bacterium]|nr:tRNA (N6-threonylcarbamoyladenosine(37)-N6)-methyltransferase TrmO [Desulfobacula sp.]MBU4130550.1 tRNA (N6-threonylcarbamoyladenosine(37)-N6)-methyltransferase TrmO [Pseudomonadota bacterium]